MKTYRQFKEELNEIFGLFKSKAKKEAEAKAKQAEEDKKRRPGALWSTATGTWGAKSRDGKTVRYFKNKNEAAAWVKKEHDRDVEAQNAPPDRRSEPRSSDVMRRVDAAQDRGTERRREEENRRKRDKERAERERHERQGASIR